MRLAVIADTHLPGRARDLPPQAWQVIHDSDAVIHAGDVVTDALLDRLRAHAPVHAALGNNDMPLRGLLPETIELDCEGVSVAVVHNSGPAQGRRARLRRMFPQARVVVFGHSHIPMLEDDGGLLLLNPGSPTDRRRMPSFSMATLDCSHGQCSAALLDLGLQRG